MVSKSFQIGAGLAAAVAAVALAGVARRPPAALASAPSIQRTIELTIYHDDFALVREQRPAQLQAGHNVLSFEEISRQMDPQSVLLRWSGDGTAAPQTIGHSYDLGLRTSQDLLSLEVGKEVELVRYGENGREAGRERGRLLVAENGHPAVLDVGGRLHVNPRGTVIVPANGDVAVMPRLSVQAESPAAGGATADLAYLTRGLSWSADYLATFVPGAEDRMDVECYAMVENRTGVRYPAASVSLAAGTPNRATRPASSQVRRKAYSQELERIAGGMAESSLDYFAAEAPESVADLHLYPLKTPVSVQSEQLNRLLMLRREGVKIARTYSFRAPDLRYYGTSSGSPSRGPVTVAVSFLNTETDAFGLPLAAGAIRVYDPDSAGRLRYAGAGRVEATPKNQKVGVTLANAFDVTAEHRVVSSKQVANRRTRKEVEVTLRNERPVPVTVRAVQSFHGGKVLASSLPHTMLDAGTAQWQVPVPSGGETKLTYTVEQSW
jgi:hypothetical protein